LEPITIVYDNIFDASVVDMASTAAPIMSSFIVTNFSANEYSVNQKFYIFSGQYEADDDSASGSVNASSGSIGRCETGIPATVDCICTGPQIVDCNLLQTGPACDGGGGSTPWSFTSVDLYVNSFFGIEMVVIDNAGNNEWQFVKVLDGY
jgi:hypothetical protein